jgi:hypothetical protein
MTDRTQTTIARPESDDSHSTSRQFSIGNRRIESAVLLGAAGVSCITLVGWLWAGVVGLGVGIAIALVSLRSRPVVTAALAQAGLLVVVPELSTSRSLFAIAAFEIGVVAVLLSERPVEPPTVVLTAAFGAVFVGLVTSALVWTGLGGASVLLVCLVAVFSYGVHRVERVSLGLVSESSTGSTESTNSTTDPSQ